MNKGLALLELKSKMEAPIYGVEQESDDGLLIDMVTFLNIVNLDEVTPENILDKYIEYLEDTLRIPHD